eukprot:7390184-Prymnesium_polylepis.1
MRRRVRCAAASKLCVAPRCARARTHSGSTTSCRPAAARAPAGEPGAARVLQQLAEAVSHLHGAGVAHRDIKPENVLLASASRDAPAVKLIDFGLAALFGDGQSPMRGDVGTPGYSAPEVLRDKAAYGCEVDLWSVGVVAFVLMGGCNPFDPFGNARPRIVRQRVLSCEWSFDAGRWDGISVQAKTVLRALLEPRMSVRMTAQQLLQCEWLIDAASRSLGPILDAFP